MCFFCKRRVYLMERLSAEGHFFHRECFLCENCGCTLRLGSYSYIPPTSPGEKGHFLCHLHYDQLLYKMQEEPVGMFRWSHGCVYRVFSYDVTAAMLVSQINESAAMLVSQTNPLGVELFSYANSFFCSNKFASMLATWVKTLYSYQVIFLTK